MAGNGDSGEKTSAEEAAKRPATTALYQAMKEQPWIESVVQQVLTLKQSVQETADSAMAAARSRLSEIRSTSHAHFYMTLGYLLDAKAELEAYEDAFVGKMKEGLLVAAAHPTISCGVAAGAGLVALKRPRRFLFYSVQRLLFSEERLIAKADARVKELRQSIDSLKFESKKLEDSASKAEEEMLRGRHKLGKAGSQIQGTIGYIYKIERQIRGLKDILSELPRRDASQFRSQVSSLASEVKRERNALSKEVTKITNYGISV